MTRDGNLLRITSSRSAARSARVRPAHQHHRGFNASPAFRIFGLALLFTGASLLSDLGNGPITMGFQQLPRVVMHIGFSHPHSVILLFLHATGYMPDADETVSTDTLACYHIAVASAADLKFLERLPQLG